MALNPANFTLNTTSGFVDVPFVAIPLSSEIVTIKTHTWVWGDGTISQSTSASHQYATAGVYEIHHITSAYSGATYTATQSVTANSVVQDTVTMAWGSPTIIAGIPNALTIEITSKDLPTLTLHYDNSNSSNPSLQATDPVKYWDHLIPMWSFTQGDLTHATTSPDITSSAITINDQVIGYASRAIVDFIDQQPNAHGVVWATLKYGDTTNSRVYAASSVRVDALNPDSTHTSLKITRDGISNFGANQYSGIAIPYVTTVVDSRLPGLGIMHYAYDKSIPTIFISTVTGDSYTIVPKGMSSSIVCGTSSTHTTNVASAINTTTSAYILGTVLLPTSATTISLSAQVNFSVAPFEDGNELRRFNEEFSFADILKQYAPSNIVEKAPFFFNEYINAIFGDAVSGTSQDIGIKTYEKIANFVQNHGDIDTCNIPQLVSTAIMTGVPIDKIAHQLPDDFKRILDIISVPFSKVAPTACACNRTFKDCAACCDGGLACKLCKLDKRGNRGSQINCETYTVSAGTSIVYFDNTLNSYNLLYTIPVSSGTVSTYDVDAIDYGGMIQPICDNYVLYEYLPTPSQNPIESIINWNSTNTTADPTMTYADWVAEDGIMEQIIKYYLINGVTGSRTSVSALPAYPLWNGPTNDWDQFVEAENVTNEIYSDLSATYTFVSCASGMKNNWVNAAPNGYMYATPNLLSISDPVSSRSDGWYAINSFDRHIVQISNNGPTSVGPSVLTFGADVVAFNNSSLVKIIDTASNVITTGALSGDVGGGSIAANGCVYYPPRQTNRSIKYDPTADATTYIGSTISGSFRYTESVLGANGCIYCPPVNGNLKILKIDPTTDTVSFVGSIVQPSGFAQYSKAILSKNGDAYFMSTAATPASGVIVLDTITEEIRTLPHHGYDIVTNFAAALDGNLYALASTGTMTPYNLVKFNPDTETFSVSSTTIPYAFMPTCVALTHTGRIIVTGKGTPAGFWFIFDDQPNVDINRVLSRFTM